jgi:hypothetical protein
MTLAACEGSGAPASATSTTAGAVTTSGVTADISFQSDWTAGYCANVVLRNDSASAVTSWTVAIVLNQSTVSQQPWGGIATVSGGVMTVKPADYTTNIAPGTSVSFGFCGSSTGSNYHPTLSSLSAVGGSTGPTSYTLSVQPAGTGAGTVSSTPAGISCGTTCSASYASGTAVTLTAAAASGSTFAGWSGACTGAATCVLSMTAARTVTATFNVAQGTTYALTVSNGGTGSGTVTSSVGGISCGSVCIASYASGTTVTLTAAAASGSTFAGWSGACAGTATCIVGMTAARAVTATFNAVNGSCTPPVAGSRGTNPLFTDQFTADPAALVDGCTFYIQCGHDEAAAGQNAFVMREWFLLSSTDMVHWTKTVAMNLGTFRWANANAWAGQMVKAANGRYYWYVPVQQSSDGTMTIGVAVANSPAGPWTDALGKPLVNDAFEMSNMGLATPSATPFTIDPTVFVDDDGTAYLHYGGFGRMVVARLNADMVSINGKMSESTPRGYFESPYLTKRSGVYYEIYAAGSNPATIDYATSTSPLGPWTYRGRVLDAFPRAAGQTDWPTNHAGVAQLAGQWYIVYHVSNGPNGGGTYRREVAVDKLFFNADGTIQKVTPSSGLTF